jgi:hypothetical protein
MEKVNKTLNESELLKVSGGNSGDLSYDIGRALGRYISNRPMPTPSPYGCVGGAR